MEPLRPTDPQSIGRYRLAGRLGAGGMGEVFLGHSQGGRAVAVKVVRAELASDAQFRRRFAREVEAARKVGGFHTAQVVDIDLDADPPWLVTAYVPGPSLAAVVAEHGALPERSLRVLGAGLAEALEAIHSVGLVHRDLKPANILLASDGPRVIDFGIAQVLEGTALTVPGGSIGTPGFMAPEHLRGEDVGPAADVFALGAVLCHAAGVRPFGDGPVHTLMYRIVHEEPDLGGLPDGLRALVAGCLAKDPADRPPPTDLLERLGADGGPIGEWLPAQATRMLDRYEEAPSPPSPPRPAPVPAPVPVPVPPAPAVPPPRPRRTWPVWAGVGAAGLVVTLAIGVLIASRPSSGTGGSSPSPSNADGGSPAVERCEPEGRSVTDPQGRAFETWSCRTVRQGPLYLERRPGTTVGYLRSSSNWFVCQAQGSANPEGTGSTWLYTQGDDRFENDGWGWFPASSVSATWGDDPVPGIPPCTF